MRGPGSDTNHVSADQRQPAKQERNDDEKKKDLQETRAGSDIKLAGYLALVLGRISGEGRLLNFILNI